MLKEKTNKQRILSELKVTENRSSFSKQNEALKLSAKRKVNIKLAVYKLLLLLHILYFKL